MAAWTAENLYPSKSEKEQAINNHQYPIANPFIKLISIYLGESFESCDLQKEPSKLSII